MPKITLRITGLREDFSGFGISLIRSSGCEILKQNRGEFWD